MMKSVWLRLVGKDGLLKSSWFTKKHEKQIGCRLNPFYDRVGKKGFPVKFPDKLKID